jgi:hypothetical protein
VAPDLPVMVLTSRRIVLMRNFTVLIVSVFVFGALALGQAEPKPIEVPNTEFYGGYAYQYADTSGNNFVDVNSTSLNGFAIEFSRYPHSKLGYTIDVSWGTNGSVDPTGISYSRTTYMVGPAYRLHQFGFLTPSLHVLGGVVHDKFSEPTNLPSTFNQTDLDFSAAAGATFDGTLSRHLAVRIAQVDYLYTHLYGTSQSSFRYTGGVVVRF